MGISLSAGFASVGIPVSKSGIEKLPLSGLPRPNQADVVGKGGSSVVYFDAFGIPGVYIPGRRNRYYWDITQGEWVSERTPVGGLSNIFLDNRGILTHRSEQGGLLWRTAVHGAEGKLHKLPENLFHEGNRSYTANLDWQTLLDSGIWTTILPKYENRENGIPVLNLEFSFSEDSENQ